ncbi:aminotransferase class I/II-fold pyridoxal phosphate-dependent enzyme [Photorhabdus luminescens]|uniref:aminotransferase class I/II-fold pyridoxal phosphate-dependent enzyme n=1 Tax=Photorhabdus luminescens TaxID=29488 RepID=UPI00223F3E8E|nr:aminotransferase class I/II-fold pyridoxal phosphate-dependent enzyme [Photorhabdus luminescens]MCW7763597.1 aminotransferase class I/II-fold pyridoxal phosphate-dependent enzyme [Photorhabdus luminescens subsp. venezuelensis]
MNIKTVILLCAGRGSRLSTRTSNKPKPLVETNQISFIDNALRNIESVGIEKVIIVVGYKSDVLMSHVKQHAYNLHIEFVNSDKWESTNNIYSLYLARNWIKQDTLILEGDIFFTKKCLESVMSKAGDLNVLVSPLSPNMEGTYAKVDNDKIVALNSTKDNNYQVEEGQYKTVNIYNICTANFAEYITKALESYVNSGATGLYYEDIFKQSLLNNVAEFKASIVDNSQWYEVDNTYDLAICDFISSNNKLELVQNRHGGYWRYPIIDFGLIYNFNFPPKKLKDEIKNNFDEILLNYPGGNRLVEHALSEFIGIERTQLCISNGAAEIIKRLPDVYTGKVLVTVPSFNEYANCFGKARTIYSYTKEHRHFEIDIDEVLTLVKEEQPSVVVIESPNNPTGKLTAIDSLLYLAGELLALNIDLIIDESFLDFSKMRDDTMLKYLDNYKNLSVIRSMSKTFGIGGIRIGYIATANQELLGKIRAVLPIWNINGFAEEFLLRLPQYRESYKLSCEQVISDTLKLQQELNSIEGITAFETDSNFVYCKLHISDAKTISRLLLDIHGLYVKECSGKGNSDSDLYLRISCRTQSDNEILINALRTIMQWQININDMKSIKEVKEVCE